MKILVIADDLTGGLDTGVQFAARGIPSRVIVDGQHWQSGITGDKQALILDAETRRMDGREAYETVKNIVQEACSNDVDYIYKKTDSAQRGNIGCELQAVLDGAKQSVLHYVPAFPQMGRITKDGIHYVNDMPVADSVFGLDPYEPVRHSFIPDIIHEQSAVAVEMDQGQEEGLHADRRIRLYDASNEEELREITVSIAAGRNDGQVTLLGGCAGFASALAQVLQEEGQAKPQLPKKQKLLVVIGSVNPITGQQMEHALKNGFVRLRLKMEQFDSGYWETPEGSELLESWKRIYHDNSKIILDTSDEQMEKTIATVLEYARESGRSPEHIRSGITRSLGTVVCALLQDMAQTALMVVGGDTLRGLIQQLNVQELVPVCEIAQGVVCSEFIKDGEAVRVLSKSGGFGGEMLLTDLADVLL